MSGLNKTSAEVWNLCVQIDKDYKLKNQKSATLSILEFATKQKFFMHAKGIQHAVFKYYNARFAMWQSRKARHKNSGYVELPYKEKSFLSTGWDDQAIRCDYGKGKIKLTAVKGQGQVTCNAKSIPRNIVEIELVYKDKYYLAIKYKEENNTNLIQSDSVASIDLGEIHAITSIDNNGNSIIITNRLVRSLVRLKDKRKKELLSLRSRCQKGSRKYNKYTRAILKIRCEFDKKINDIIHKQTKKYVSWCEDRGIRQIYYGDLDGVTRNSKDRLRKSTNQKLNMWRFGQIENKLNYKLFNIGTSMIKINEAYTSQKCPACGKLNKTSTRNYGCKCGYSQHRDIVGAINILNNNSDYNIQRYVIKEYLQIC